ncbi:NAD-dependent epimerase/dehydratase family protein [Thermomonospora umbrina]|uniref:Nucleoside-diphosphate-sugar epimerase n=1 Tax=Thermomonospora umbrina TaxID=111806 RepID=A0A3D9T9T6_9ACTN|nr:NAD-dependent epimerase/dehydratase family protein [Thermomonospora umbrina]REF00532.1 nucleoside-diphosphate-sugar epimerase [Thermomonospora umbrina]
MTIYRIPQAPSDRRPATGLVVVTGVCGFVGSHLAEHLLAREGTKVLGVDLRKPDEDPRTSAIMAELQARPGFELVSADVGDAAVAARLKEAAAVVHLAAPTDVAASWGSGFADQTASLLSSHRLLEGCANARVPRVVVASSAHVYGHVVGPAREDTPVAPNSPYGVVKLATERLAMAFARRPGSTMSAVAVRLFTGFGTRVNPAMVVPRMFRSALTKQPMPLYGDGRVTHTWTHVDDLVDALTRAIGIPLEAGQAEVVNAAGADQASLRQVGDLIGQIVGSPVLWEPAGERPGDTAGLHADLTHAHRILGFAPRVGLREGLESLWQTYAVGPATAAVPAERQTR